jgi:large subunit ribosomal protein L21
MYAVVEIAGTQVRVVPAQKVVVPLLSSEAGATVKFDNVLVLNNGTTTKIGAPYVSGSTVQAKIVRHLRDETVIVLKKKKRKGYRVRNGHRQQFTEVEITSIS